MRIMGKNIARSFYELGIFVFFLYSTKVLSAPSVTLNVIDVMRHDKKLCEVPTFLYENKITKECHTVPYPKGDVLSDIERIKTFLCLALYDTLFKQCYRDQWPFNNATTFESYIQTFLPGNQQDEQTYFCENIKGIQFSYENLIPFLSHVNLNNSHVCSGMCVDMTGDFIPLCGILAWSKSMDDEMKHANKDQETGSHSDPVSPKLSNGMNQHKQGDSSKPLVAEISKEITQGTVKSVAKSDKFVSIKNIDKTENTAQNNKPENDINNKGKPSITKVKTADIQLGMDTNYNNIKNKNGGIQLQASTDNDNEVKTGNSHVQIDIGNDNLKDNSAPSQMQIHMNNNNARDKSTDSEVQIVTDIATKSGHRMTDNKKETSETLQKVSGEKDKLEDPKNVENSNEDIKISIPSQNTQDHGNSANQIGLGPMEDDKFDNDPNEGTDQFIDTAEQAQSVPEPSEQREVTSHYHSIRTDEESHFFTYFTIVSLVSIAAYIGYHNKQKILAIVLEGRRSRSSRGRRRPSTANYRKLDCTLEEAVTSQCSANVTHVIY